MQDFEKLGVFYLGKQYDMEAGAVRDDLLLYDSKDLTTHAVCVGMTGSGKTGLCIDLLEEAAIDSIPALIIDPKGDLGNLMLSFPQLRPEDFCSWVDPAEATRKGKSVDEYAASTAELWKNGLAQWGEDGARIQRFRDSVDITVYTPGSRIGVPLTVLKSFQAPSAALLQNTDSYRERIGSAVSGLLALLGVDADPIRSREHILLSNIFDVSWKAGKDLDIGNLIREIQTPPFDRIGVIGLENFYPQADRFQLAMLLNNLLASPGFSSWMEGESLDIQKMLYSPDGKPRFTILSIAHLSEAERMFFVTIFLNEVVSWMRAQSGTSSLRAILYMDEVFGYFPPTANPPSKTPMLTLLKQARAFGLGVVLATQNPVDLDYKGLSNAGTWFIGRLQTERDKARVLDGLEGASAAAGHAFDRRQMEVILSGLGSRVFLLNNVHEDQPVIFQTRWSLSYLRGPLSREQIQTLMEEKRKLFPSSSVSPSSSSATAATARPVLPPDVPEFFIAPNAPISSDEKLVYRPALLGQAMLHFTHSKADLDVWRKLYVIVPAEDTTPDQVWQELSPVIDKDPSLQEQPTPGALFHEVPGFLMQSKVFGQLSKQLKDVLYQSERINLWSCDEPKGLSSYEETEADFRRRLVESLRENRDLEVEKLRARYAPKLAVLEERIRKAEYKVDTEKAQASQQSMQTYLNIGQSILGALLGRKLTSSSNISKAASSIRSAGRSAKENADVGHAQETVEVLKQQLADLETEFQKESAALTDSAQPQNLKLEQITVTPKKTELTVQRVALVWTPWRMSAQGMIEPAS